MDVRVFGRYHKEKIYPTNFVIFNGVNIYKWINGNSSQLCPESPKYESCYTYPVKRKERFAREPITIIPSIFNNNEILCIGSIFSNGTNQAKVTCDDIRNPMVLTVNIIL